MSGWLVLGYLLQFLQVLIFARVILSWVAPRSRNGLVELVRQVTEPILAPIRSIMPGTGPVDFSPMIALFIIYLLQSFIARSVY